MIGAIGEAKKPDEKTEPSPQAKADPNPKAESVTANES
jgi:hypothetical protein